MAYLALARKWRPKTFADVVGQSHVIQALSNSLESGKVHHAFLFTGTRGVGKTTIARIFAKALNCEQGLHGEPCAKCDSCIAIDLGRYVDLIEVDAASRTKVDDTRELLDNVQYAPSFGKYKVFLIDEVHMLSGHSFNALLKTLEEPPEHVKFLFATTDPQKLPITVLSRCLQFNLRAMQVEQIEKQLHRIAQAEQVNLEKSAVRLLAKAADGSMRDGLSLLDQAIALAGDTLSEDVVRSMLGSISFAHSSAILRDLVEGDVDGLMRTIAEMAAMAVDFNTAIDDLLLHLYYLSLYQVQASCIKDKDVDSQLIHQLAQQIDANTVQLYYQSGLIAKRDIALAPTLRVGFEMALLRMLAFELSGAQPPVDSGVGTSIAESPTKSSSPLKAEVAEPLTTQPAESNREFSAANEVMANKPNARNNDVLDTITCPWARLVLGSDLEGMSKELAMNTVCADTVSDNLRLSLAPSLEILYTKEREKEIEVSLSSALDKSISINVHFEEVELETPAQILECMGIEEHKQLLERFAQDNTVQGLVSALDLQVDAKTARPIKL